MAGYGATSWVDGGVPALSAANLNKIEAALLAALGYDTTAALRAAGRPTAVQTVQTRGGTTLGDGLGGWWWWDSAATDADDASTVLLPDGHSGAGRWRRLADVRGVASAIPAGVVWETAADAAPEGWYLCQGQAVSRTTDARLFAAIGTKYGVGNGTTTFNLPDRRDRVGVGASATHALGSIWGATTVSPTGTVTVNSTTLTISQIPSHGHTLTDPGHTHFVNDPGHIHRFSALQNQWSGLGLSSGGFDYNIPTENTAPATTGIYLTAATTGITLANNGGGGGHTHTASWSGPALSIEQPSFATNFIIKR